MDTDVYVNWSGVPVAEVPPAVVTVISTVPLPAGLIALICVSLTTVKLLAAVCPKPVPLITTFVPPVVTPLVGLIPVTTGGEIM